ncbi:MAG: hypothetical protein ABSA77_07050 [Thermoguttaceae bacterium]|jgi:hypothetical protein
MYRIYRWPICLIFLLSLLILESQAAPPGGGPGKGFGGGTGGAPGGVFHINGGNVPNHGNGPYHGGGFPGWGPYGPNYHGWGYPGGWHGGPGPYYGGWPGFHLGITIPFGYDDYDWYAPYYNYYNYRYYYYDPSYYSGTEYYSVDSPIATAQYPPTMSTPPIPTPAQAARLTDEQLRMMIAVALENYIKDLDAFTSGESWKKHFKLAELKDRISALQNASPDAATRALVADISQKFQAAGTDPTYAAITKPWSFQTLLVALQEYSLTAVQRQNHTLYAKAETLKRSLDNVSSGEDWKIYLQINELEKLLAQPPIYNAEMNKNLEKILVRFDNVAQNSQYKAVADLQGFDVTRTGLQQYIYALRAEPANGGALIPSLPPPPPAESSSGKATL